MNQPTLTWYEWLIGLGFVALVVWMWVALIFDAGPPWKYDPSKDPWACTGGRPGTLRRYISDIKKAYARGSWSGSASEVVRPSWRLVKALFKGALFPLFVVYEVFEAGSLRAWWLKMKSPYPREAGSRPWDPDHSFLAMRLTQLAVWAFFVFMLVVA